jgi:hypothetical protein
VKLFGQIYSLVEESFEELKKVYLAKDLKSIVVKDLEKMCSGATKRGNLVRLETQG